ncbi:MAG: STAS domain-containing protein [Verrucomicrobia bacterium]|nr:STAS domain-containing protein [Verrucomicrobiota bacterium]MBU4292025.1 STAS domain-containing protein [Verrucomicrobiota bacterium]MBU4427913.1 STAS domain-containing protein [Verrucomicrobiota bacterium]MCG2678859.1 STAS domain-containing protein [Kiritimatiellia bacterium]
MGLIIVQETSELSHVALSGRLDAPGVEELEEEFFAHTESRRLPALVDMSAVTFIASMGIRMLIRCAQALHHAEVRMVLINPQPLVKNALDTAGITPMIHIASDAIQALAQLADE